MSGAAVTRGGTASASPEVAAPPLEKDGVDLVPAFVSEVGGMVDMTRLALQRGLRPPYDWGAEFVSQFRFVIRMCVFPLIVSAFALSFGPAGIQASNFFGLFGALDRMGGAYVIIVVRMFGPLVTAIVLAGAAGTAVCADLGAREVREETSALRVLGIDPVRMLVWPRLLALMLAGVLLNVLALLAGMGGLVVVVYQNHGDLGPVFSTFFSNANALEFSLALLKSAIYGFVIAVVCCYKGLTVSGGPSGVGRAVNRSVVIAFVAIGFIDYAFSQFVLATNPLLSQVRG